MLALTSYTLLKFCSTYLIIVSGIAVILFTNKIFQFISCLWFIFKDLSLESFQLISHGNQDLCILKIFTVFEFDRFLGGLNQILE